MRAWELVFADRPFLKKQWIFSENMALALLNIREFDQWYKAGPGNGIIYIKCAFFTEY